MTRRIVFALFCTLVAAAAAADIHGAWTANADGPDRIQAFMTTGGWHNFGQTWKPGVCLNAPELTSAQTVPVNLKIAREAGTIVLEGTFKHGDGAGQFTFTPNRELLTAIRGTGLTVDIPESRSEDDELFKLAVLDVTPEYIDSLRKLGVEVGSLHEAIRLRAFNVTPAFIAELASAGYTKLSTRDLIRAAAVGVDAKFIRDMSRYGSKQ